jgi:hypothetical protein
MYRAIGFRSTRVAHLEAAELSPRLFQALVHWTLHDGNGGSLYAFDATYTLAQAGDVLRITALAHNEVSRYRQCLARLRSAPEGHAGTTPPKRAG